MTGSQYMLTQGRGEAKIPMGSEVVSGIQCHQRAFPLTLQSRAAVPEFVSEEGRGEAACGGGRGGLQQLVGDAVV